MENLEHKRVANLPERHRMTEISDNEQGIVR
jgi:hypothetical protein